MRILQMISDIGVSNGIMSVILNYFKAMPEDIKFDVVYFARTQQTRQADIEALGGRVFKVDSPSPSDFFSGKMDSFFEAHRGEWSALHIHCPHFAVFIAPYAKKHGIDKIAVHCHSTCYSLKGHSSRNKLLSTYAKYCIKNRFACSDEAGKLWYSGKEFTVLNNAVDCKAYAYDTVKRSNKRAQMGLDDSFVVGHIGRTGIPQKNHKFLITVFSKIKAQRGNSVLLLMGGDKTEELANLCKELGVEDSVRFLGSRTDICELLQACDAFLFPSISEGLPVSVIEAQASGLPVVMSDSVTKEVCVTDNVTRLSLNIDAQKWADVLIEMSDKERKDLSVTVAQHGWDIYDNAKLLADFYRK